MDSSPQKTVTVPLSPEAAFDLFTTGIAEWWPHPDQAEDLRFEPHRGGALTERGKDGRRIRRGRVLAWDRGVFLCFEWWPRDADPEAEPSVVTVAFDPDPAGSRVSLGHGAASILGAPADAVSASTIRAWRLTLGCYAAAQDTKVPA